MVQDEKELKQEVLRKIIASRVNGGDYVFYKPYLNREYIAGFIGDRGGGKSASSSVVSIVDFMLRGKPVWSNMKVIFNFRVTDTLARLATGGRLQSGGIVHLESLPLEKDKLLNLDDTYRGGCLLIEEINVQFSNVRRFMTNTNLESNIVAQQLRKFGTSLIYNVIDEMFIDSQLRALTDIFVRTYDTAFDLDKMAKHKKPGIDFCWQIYPYSAYLRGEQGRYSKTHKPEKRYLKFEKWQGIYNDKQHQIQGVYSLSKKEREKLESSEDTWIDKAIKAIRQYCRDNNLDYLKSQEIAQLVGRPLNAGIRSALSLKGISWDTYAQAYLVVLPGRHTQTTAT